MIIFLYAFCHRLVAMAKTVVATASLQTFKIRLRSLCKPYKDAVQKETLFFQSFNWKNPLSPLRTDKVVPLAVKCLSLN